MKHQELKKNDAIIRALDALNFDAGDWKPENVERHLREQIELAKEILNGAGTLIHEGTSPATQGDEVVPQIGEWWMMKSTSTLRMSPMILTENGWGALLNADGKPLPRFVTKQKDLTPLYRMLSAKPPQGEVTK